MSSDVTALLFRNLENFLGQKVLLFGRIFASVLVESLLAILLLMFPQIPAFDKVENVKRYNPGPQTKIFISSHSLQSITSPWATTSLIAKAQI